MEQTIKCPICGAPYKVYGHYAGDQSACRKCRDEAKRAEKTIQPATRPLPWTRARS